MGADVVNYLRSEGIQMQYTAPYTPQQNGVAERKNRTLIEMARCMLLDADLPYTFWAEAVNTANYIQNRVSTRATDTTPFEAWNGGRPATEHFQIFGAKCFVHVPAEKRQKLDDTAREMIFLGYDENSKAYRCYDQAARRLVISRDVRFQGIFEKSKSETVVSDETVNDNAKPDPGAKLEKGESEDEQDSPVETDEEDGDQPGPRRVSQRSNKGVPPRRLIDEIRTVSGEIQEPKSLSEALSSAQRDKWLEAMRSEMESLNRNDTWELRELPEGKSAVGCKWVYKLKRNGAGEIERYKARLVAQGFSQKFGTDYDQVFAPVARQMTFRALLALASREGHIVRHVDAKTAFLNGTLKETIFMKQPPGFENEDKRTSVCLLKKSLYGLKQAARSWNDAINAVLIEMNFDQSKADVCLYSRQADGERCCTKLLRYRN